jgi:hypothetical protein
MDRMQNLMILFLVLPLIGSIAAGCNTGTEEPSAPDSGSGTTDTDPAAAAAAASEIDPSRFPTDLPDTVKADIPDNFPTDLPIYPGSAPAQGAGGEHEGIDMAALQLLTLDSPGKVYGYYMDELESSGWDLSNSEETEEKAFISAAKDGRRVSILFAPTSDGGSDIFIVTESGEIEVIEDM